MINKASQLCFLQRANVGQMLFYDILCLRFDTAVTDRYMISWNVLMGRSECISIPNKGNTLFVYICVRTCSLYDRWNYIHAWYNVALLMLHTCLIMIVYGSINIVWHLHVHVYCIEKYVLLRFIRSCPVLWSSRIASLKLKVIYVFIERGYACLCIWNRSC